VKEVTHRTARNFDREDRPREPSLSLNFIEQEVLSTASLEGGEAHEDVVLMEADSLAQSRNTAR
jgi:hypothetical protein